MRSTRIPVAIVILSAVTFVTPACSSPGVSTCVPGRTEACACAGGTAGFQECTSDGRFGACQCAGVDAATVPDAAVADSDVVADAATVDAASSDDASTGADAASSDASTGADAATPADASAPEIHGHLVVIGNLLYAAHETWDALLVNAIFSSERSGDLRVLEYTEYAVPSATEPHQHDLMDAAAVSRGRPVVRSALTSATSLSSALATADVLFVPPQVYTDEATLRTIGGFWRESLVAFLDDGGVVVVVSGPIGSSGGHEYRLVEGTGLFTFTGGRMGISATTAEITAPADPIATGVLSPFPTGGASECFPSSTGGTLVARTTDALLCPLVRHLVR